MLVYDRYTLDIFEMGLIFYTHPIYTAFPNDQTTHTIQISNDQHININSNYNGTITTDINGKTSVMITINMKI